MGFNFLKCCCRSCPPCPDGKTKGWTNIPIPGCPQCPGCEVCDQYPTQKGWNTVFSNICPKCPKCEDDPCYEFAGLTAPCKCRPKKFLVIFNTDANCGCFEAQTGLPPFAHVETIGNEFLAYCMNAPSDFAIDAFDLNYWGTDGPGCGAPATLIDSGTASFIQFEFDAGTPTIISISITGNLFSGGVAAIFCGQLATSDCKGPWRVDNSLTGPCNYVNWPGPNVLNPRTGFTCPTLAVVGSPLLKTQSTGGYAMVYPCGC